MKQFYYGTLFALLILAGCEGEEEPYTPPPSMPVDRYCEEMQSTTLDSLSSVGEHTHKSALDLLSSIGLNRKYTAYYATENSVAVQSPLGGTTELSLSFDLESASAKEVYPTEGIVGPSFLEINLNINVETSDGAFSETWPAILVYEPDQSLRLEATYNPENFNGDFRILERLGLYKDSPISGVLIEDFTDGMDNIRGEISILATRTDEVIHSNGHSSTMLIGQIQRLLTWPSEQL